MKKITLLLISVLSMCYVHAQISYQSADFAIQGEAYTVSEATAGINSFDFTATGPQYTWDFSALPVTTQNQISYVDPATSGYKTSWCFSNGYILNCTSQFNSNFNLATKTLDGLSIQGYGITNVYDHIKLSTADVRVKMVGATITSNNVSVPVTMNYTAPDVLYTFPITYQSTSNSNSAYSIDLSAFGIPVQYAQQAQRTNNTEGWGSLITPFGTFANVLKVKTTLVTAQAITGQNQTQNTTTTTVSYKWFDKAYGIPVLEVSGNVVNGFWVATRITYIDNPRCLQPVAAFAYLPLVPDIDPATGGVTVSFVNSSANYSSVSWDFGDGVLSTQENPIHTFTCPGTKTVTLTALNNLCSPVQTATINLPVVVTDTQGVYTNEVTVNGTTLTANRTLTGTTYQWVNCNQNNAVIEGATAQSFTPVQNGTYAVVLTTNGCESTSACFDVNVFPPMELPVLNDVTATCSATLTPPQAISSCGETLVATTTTIFPITQTGVTSVVWVFNDCNDMEQTVTQNVTITGINPVIVPEGDVLVATPQGSEYYYEWIYCDENQTIAGATSDRYTPVHNGSYAVLVGIANQCFGITDCYRVDVAGTKTNIISHATLYPNPATDGFTIQSALPVIAVNVYNYLGQCVATSASLQGLAAGCYIVKIRLQDGNEIEEKIVKK